MECGPCANWLLVGLAARQDCLDSQIVSHFNVANKNLLGHSLVSCVEVDRELGTIGLLKSQYLAPYLPGLLKLSAGYTVLTDYIASSQVRVSRVSVTPI